MATGDLCSLSDVRLDLELPTADTSRDALISDYITSASQEIIARYEREFAPATTSETRRFQFDPSHRIKGCTHIDLAPYDCRSLTAATLHPENGSQAVTLTVGTDIVLQPVGGWPRATSNPTYTHVRLSRFIIVNSTLFQSFGYCQLDLTGSWGFSAVPGPVAKACRETVCSWVRRDFPSFALEDVNDAQGTLQPDRFGTYDIPTSARRKLAKYMRRPNMA